MSCIVERAKQEFALLNPHPQGFAWACLMLRKRFGFATFWLQPN